MKIALIGNMNNNNFAIMRYFRDLGADAHLLLYKNDGYGTLSHFQPKFDTWDIERWAPFIHQTDLMNGYVAVLGNISPYRELYFLRFLKGAILRHRDSDLFLPGTDRNLILSLRDYDYFIGSGISPAILNRIGLSLDIFYPYGAGIEFLGTQEFQVELRARGLLMHAGLKKVARAQEDGIRRARHCLNAEPSLTKQAFEKIGVDFIPMNIPMVYNLEKLDDEDRFSPSFRQLKSELDNFDLTLISHCRLMWVNPGGYTDTEWEQASKHNDWLIRGYAEFSKAHPNTKALLLLLEYGPDVKQTKTLCHELGIQNKVRWLPKMARRDLLQIIGLCDVGVGQFCTDKNAIWGGTGWEVLGCGRPLLQGFRFEEGEFESIYGYPPPPMLPVKSPGCVCKHLIDMANHPDKREAIGKGAANWFNQYNGIGLAKKWLDLLKGTTTKAP